MITKTLFDVSTAREVGDTEAGRIRNELRTIAARITANAAAGRGLRKDDRQRWERYNGLLASELGVELERPAPAGWASVTA